MIVSFTPTSETKQTIIGDALRSIVHQVDKILIIHLLTGDEPDQTLAIARDIAGPKLEIVTCELAGTHAADWRNLGLKTASVMGGTWALQLDTDERMLWGKLDLRKSLAGMAPEVETLLVTDDSGRYEKPRIFRLPAKGQFVQGTHEDYTHPTGHLLPFVRFHELQKTPEQLEARLWNDLTSLRAQAEADPMCHRWRYYTGVTLEALKHFNEAIDSYHQSLTLEADAGMHAWVCYRIAHCLHHLDQHDTALAYCLKGMGLRPEFPELSWFAAVQCQTMGRHQDAIAWAKIAIAHTQVNARVGKTVRIGFRDPLAAWEGPYQVMAAAYAKTGESTLESWARREAMRLQKARILHHRGVAA